MPDKSKEEVLKIVQREVDAYPDRWRGGVSCWQAVNKKTGILGPSCYATGTACHGGVTGNVAGFYVVNAHKPNLQGKYPDFTKWVCQGSPFSHGVINQDKEDEILNKASVIDGDEVGKGGVLWLCKALRYTVEDTFRIPNWRILQEHGLDPLQAFIGCSILAADGRPLLSRTHCGLFVYNTPDNIYAWYKELLKEKKRNTVDATRPDSWVPFGGRQWGSMGVQKVKKSDGWGGFTMVDEPANPDEFVTKLKTIFKGDYKNV